MGDEARKVIARVVVVKRPDTSNDFGVAVHYDGGRAEFIEHLTYDEMLGQVAALFMRPEAAGRGLFRMLDVNKREAKAALEAAFDAACRERATYPCGTPAHDECQEVVNNIAAQLRELHYGGPVMPHDAVPRKHGA